MESKLIRKEDFKSKKWSGGETSQIYIYPEHVEYPDLDFLFRISSATIEIEKSEFSHLDGIYRYISTLENTIELSHDDIGYKKIKPFEIYEFKGDISTFSKGKTRDFNLMISESVRAKIEAIKIEKDKILEFKGDSKFIFLFNYGEGVNLFIDKPYALKAMDTILIKLEGEETIEVKLDGFKNEYVIVGEIYF